jgi:hypothetical protein
VSAIQHRCNRTDTNVFGFQGLIERDALTPEGLANMIAVPVEIIVGLGEMPDEAFAQYTDRMKKRLERWRNRGERGELEIVFGRLLDAIRESGVHAGAQDKMIGPASWVIPYLRTIKGPISDLATLVVPTGFPTETLSDAASYAIDKLDGVARDRVIKSFVDYADRRLDETGG